MSSVRLGRTLPSIISVRQKAFILLNFSYMQGFRVFEQKAMERLAQGRVILDVGGGTRFMKGMKAFESLFANSEYRTMDISPDYGPDIVGDIHAIPLAEQTVDGVVCRSVLEHVQAPAKAVQEMHRVLKPNGLLFLIVPSICPYHARKGHGAYPDYWRFFEDSLKLLLADFSEVEIVKQGGWFRAMSNFVPFQAKLRFLLDPLADAFDALFQTERRNTTAFYYVLARK